jgi:hypothetical protein
MLLWGIMMVRPAISPGLDTKSQRLYARLYKVWCTTTVVFWVSAGLLMSVSLTILTPHTAMRWMLGMMEAGFFPGVAYYLSWYAHIPLPFWSGHSQPL